MGEIADMMIEGFLDCETGEWNGFEDEGPGFPMTQRQAAAYRGEAVKTSRPGLWGDWLKVAQAVQGAEVERTVLRETLGLSRKRVNGLLNAMIAAGILRCQGSRYWLTQRGLMRLAETPVK